MGMARLVVTAVVVEGRSKSEVARAYGVSRRWVHELVVRYRAEGEAGLVPRSKRPHHSPGRISQELEDAIVTLRKDLAGQGLDAGAATIAALLAREQGTAPAVSTIWRVLSRRGFITPQPQKRPKSSYIRFEADQPNERWQADTTHWRLADGTGVEILNIIDDHSRLAVASTVRPTFKTADVVEAFTDAFQRHGVPATVLTDNAAIFTGAPRGHGKVAFETHLEALGVRLIHSRAYHPQTCGKIERFHQTLKRWLAMHPADTLADLQTLLDEFTRHYNTRRPHRALARRTPHEAWHARPAAGPGTLTATHYRLRRDTINNGTVTLRHHSRLHHIGIGKRHNGTPVTLLIADLHIRVIHATTGELLRELVLDPTRDYQPRGVKPGPQPTPTCNDVPRQV